MADDTSKAVEAAAESATAATEAARDSAKDATTSTATATKRVAKSAEAATKKNNRRAKAQRRTRRTARKPETAAATERTKDVNFDPNNWLAGFGAFPAAPFQSLFAEAGERGQEAVRRSQKAAEELADLTRANVEALVDASRIAAEAARSLSEEVVESSREGIEQTAEAVRSLAEAKSATEFVQLQSEFARASFDRLVNESSRLTESFVKLAGEAFQPISTRASLNAERLNKLVA